MTANRIVLEPEIVFGDGDRPRIMVDLGGEHVRRSDVRRRHLLLGGLGEGVVEDARRGVVGVLTPKGVAEMMTCLSLRVLAPQWL
jgi:hypothetical protein